MPLPNYPLDIYYFCICSWKRLKKAVGDPVCSRGEKKANSLLGLTRKGTENKTNNIAVPLYRAMALPCPRLVTVSLKGYCRVGENIEEGNHQGPGAPF